jgi:ABC-type proline/glycine betaine transport system permease subunit
MIAYLSLRSSSGATATSPSSPRRRSRFPASCSPSGSSSLHQPPLVLYGTLAIIFLAYLTKELPVGYQQVAASLKAVHPELEEASRIFGATRLRALADITAPLIRNGVIATLGLHLHRLDPRALRPRSCSSR